MKLTYSEQLKHPKWQKRRLEILERAGFQCESCYEENVTLHVHHKHYVRGRSVWEYNDNELVALCEDCHSAYHEQQAAIYELLSHIDTSEGLFEIFMVLLGYMKHIDGPACYAPHDWQEYANLDQRLFKRGKAAGILDSIAIAAAAHGKKKAKIDVNVFNYLGKRTFDLIRNESKKAEKTE